MQACRRGAARAPLAAHSSRRPRTRRQGAERLSARAASSAPESAVASSAEQREEQAPAEANAPAAKPGFVNRQVFKVPEDMQPVFEEAWAAREEHMATMAGYLGVQMHKEGADSYVVESRWESIPAWEEFNLSKPARRHHLPTGIWQMVPKPGEGFPEDFVPFLDMNTFVQAKYPPKKKKE